MPADGLLNERARAPAMADATVDGVHLCAASCAANQSFCLSYKVKSEVIYPIVTESPICRDAFLQEGALKDKPLS